MRTGGSGNRQRRKNQPTNPGQVNRLPQARRHSGSHAAGQAGKVHNRPPLNLLKAVGDHKASFQSLGDQWADTTTAAGRLLLTILGGLAEFERELIKARTAEGRERAKGRGVRMGRKHKLTPHQQEEVRKRKAEGQSVRELGRSYNVSPNTISRVR